MLFLKNIKSDVQIFILPFRGIPIKIKQKWSNFNKCTTSNLAENVELF